MASDTRTVPPVQAAVLTSLADEGAISIASLADRIEEKPETVTGAAFGLAEEGLLSIDERTETSVTLTPEGERYRTDGLPELRLHDAARLLGGVGDLIPMGDVIEEAHLDGQTIDIALSNFARKGYGSIEAGELVLDTLDVTDEEAATLDRVAANEVEGVQEVTIDQLERRNLLERSEQTTRHVRLTDAGRDLVASGVEAADELGAITPEVLTSGAWKDRPLRSYNVSADAPVEFGGSQHPLRRMAERVTDVLVGMGFEEMDGPHVDADFWINDCLFMPQDHPARTHWDRFELESPGAVDALPTDLIERVEQAHRHGVGEDGEGYHSPWEESVARELALRGHTTSLSVRHLSGRARGELEPPQRFFSVEKVYRNDTLDATHLLEFFQIEGWVMADSLSVRDLMGTFTEFYEQFGITDLEFKPHYNPYTEPSFELFGTHPRTGELIEIGNSGIFRPEMLEPLDVECDVMAWGLALERLLMLVTGAEDIRDVHGTLVDLEFLRTQEVLY